MYTHKYTRTLRVFARSAALVGMMGAVNACPLIKPTKYFNPITEISIPIETPKFIGEVPAATLGTGPFAITSTSVTFVPVAGVTASQVTATANGQSVPVSVNGNTITASLAGKPDGLYAIEYKLSNSDFQLSKALSYQLKNIGPTITIPSVPAASSSSSASSVPLSLAGTITDSFLYTAAGAILKPGPSNICGNADNTPWPQGTGPGQVSGNTWNYTNSVMTNGSFGFNVSAFNPVSSGGQQTTSRYCLAVTAEDRAMDANGAPKHNVSSRYFPIDQTWLAAVSTFAVSATATYRHLGATSEVCITVNTTPPQPNSVAQSVIVGPGLVGTPAQNVTLGSSGSQVIRYQINQFGTYSGTVTVAGLGGNQTAVFSVIVTSAAGTCT